MQVPTEAQLKAAAGLSAWLLREYGIPLENVKVTQQIERDSETHMVTGVTIRIDIPEDFPDKYRDSLVRAVDLCTVKKHIMNPPKFTIEAVKAD